MIRDLEFGEEAIAKFIETDSVGRNRYLDSFLSVLNSASSNTYISIDADWGAGKTVFMKQIEFLNYCDLTNPIFPEINKGTLEEFQEKYAVFYYNAWENDNHEDPLQSILFSLINNFYSDEKRKKRVKSLAANAAKSISKNAINDLTKGLIDIDEIAKVDSVDDLVSSIHTTNERQATVSEIINKILPEDKKFLFIIDELDRCNPEFAVRTLEVIKHYCNDDNIVFVLSTNNRQLVHTVKKYYGDGFDGYGYLDKLYDLIFDLPPIDIKNYFQSQLKFRNDGYYVNAVPVEIASYLKMSMREINRYFALFSLVKNRLTGTGSMGFGGQDAARSLTHFLFVPFALSLKVRSIEQYDSFVAGRGETILRDLLRAKSVLLRVAENSSADDDAGKEKQILEIYSSIMNSVDLGYDRQNESVIESGEFFRRLLPLLGSVSRID